MLHIYVYIYIYMQHGLYARVYITIYTYIQVIYIYIEPSKYIYKSYIYLFYACLFILMHFIYCIYANRCRWVQNRALLHINRSVLA